ncbi:hypothetical protein B0H21DRAFT_681509, partial [Amylocystis lapponica]
AYLAVTAHFIDTDWNLRSELLVFKEHKGSHSGENMRAELYKVVKSFGIVDK